MVHFTYNFKSNRKLELDNKNRIISICHGALSFFFATYFICLYGIDFDFQIDLFSTKIVCLSLGYFLYDLIACLWFGLWDGKLVLHHILAITGFSYPLFIENGIFAGILGLLLAESSNFPMHLRAILKNMKLRHTILYELADVLYLVVYIIFRGLFAPILCFMSFFSKSTPWVVCMVFLGLTLQSLYFIRIMIKILKSKYKQHQERKLTNTPLFWLSENEKLYSLSYTQKDKKTKVF